MPARLQHLALLALFVPGITGPVGAQQNQNVTELYVQDSLRLNVGEREGLSVQAFDEKGNVVLLIKYRSSDETVARVQPNGTVSGVRAGIVKIVVQAGAKTRKVLVVVSNRAPSDSVSPAADSRPAASPSPTLAASLVVEPSAIYLLPAENLRVTARGFRADGALMGPVKVGWRSLRPEIASVSDTTGIVVGVGAGSGVIQAVAPGGVTANVSVTVALTEFQVTTTSLVMSPEGAETLHVIVPGQERRELASSGLQWRSTDLTVARVLPGGVVQATGPGQAEIVVSGYLQERRIALSVHREIARFVTSPRLGETVQLPVLGTREFHARAEAADSTPVPEVAFAWQVGDSSIAGFDPATGLLQAKQAGTTSLSAAVRGFRPITWTVKVVPGSVGLDRQRAALSPGQLLKLAAFLLDEGGQPIGPPQEPRWVSDNSSAVTVADDGTLEALRPGRALITATTAGGKSAAATIFVVGDFLLSSTRGGTRLGVYGVELRSPDLFRPLIVDSAANIQAVYSPDRTRIAFSSDRFGTGQFDIFVADGDGKSPRRLTTDAGLDVEPAWTPDGLAIVFSSTRAAGSQVFIMNADGSDGRQLTSTPGGNLHPAVSPDGKMIAFSTGRGGNAEIYTMNLDGSNQVNATGSPDRESIPGYFPNGDLAYVLERKAGPGRFQIIRQAQANGARTPIVSGETPIVYFAVSRDGERVAFATSRIVDKAKGTAEFMLFLQAVAGGTPIPIALGRGEQIASPAF